MFIRLLLDLFDLELQQTLDIFSLPVIHTGHQNLLANTRRLRPEPKLQLVHPTGKVEFSTV